MGSGKEKMGFEGLIYIGTAGSTAATPLLNSRDISITTDPEYGDTTKRGDGATIPITTSKVCAVGFSCDFTMIEKTDDTALATLKSAAANGTPIALRLKDYSSGSGYDGDVNIAWKGSRPLKGEQTSDFTATPTTDTSGGRTPQLYV